jgi:hypothetical protein
MKSKKLMYEQTGIYYPASPQALHGCCKPSIRIIVIAMTGMTIAAMVTKVDADLFCNKLAICFSLNGVLILVLVLP